MKKLLVLNHLYLLLFIVVFGFLLRLWKLDQVPIEVFRDEIRNSSSALKLIKTGTDLFGERGVFFADQVEPTPPLYGYATLPLTLIFGESAWTIRLPAAFFGTSLILLIYFLALEIFRSKSIGLVSALILATNPLAIHYSHIGWEPASWLPFAYAGVLFFLKAIHSDSIKWYLAATVSFSLSIYTYHPASLHSFLLVTTLALYGHKFVLKHWKVTLLLLGLGLILSGPYLNRVVFDEHMTDKTRRISVFSDGINQESLTTFGRAYASHFSWEFLFEHGDHNLRHGSNRGNYYSWLLGPLVAGYIWITYQASFKKQGRYWLVLVFLMYYPLVGALSTDGVPHATRTLIGNGWLILLMGSGLVCMINLFRHETAKNIVYSALIIGIGVQSLEFTHYYTTDYKYMSVGFWDYGNKAVFSSLKPYTQGSNFFCLENLSYWTDVQLLNYYHMDIEDRFTYKLDDQRCRESGTFLVKKPSNFDFEWLDKTQIKDIKDFNGAAMYQVYYVE